MHFLCSALEHLQKNSAYTSFWDAFQINLVTETCNRHPKPETKIRNPKLKPLLFSLIHRIENLDLRLHLNPVFSLTLARSPMASRSYRRASDFLNYSPGLASDILAERKSRKFFFTRFFKRLFPQTVIIL